MPQYTAAQVAELVACIRSGQMAEPQVAQLLQHPQVGQAYVQSLRCGGAL